MNLIIDCYASSSDNEENDVLSKRMRVLEREFLSGQQYDSRHDLDIAIAEDNEQLELISPTIKKAISLTAVPTDGSCTEDENDDEFAHQPKKQKKMKADWNLIATECTYTDAEYLRRKSLHFFTTKKKQKIYNCISHNECCHQLRITAVGQNSYQVEERGKHSIMFKTSRHGIHVELLEEVDSILNGNIVNIICINM